MTAFSAKSAASRFARSYTLCEQKRIKLRDQNKQLKSLLEEAIGWVDLAEDARRDASDFIKRANDAIKEK